METGGGPSVGHEDSDLERKRREAEALLQSVGITPDIQHGKTCDGSRFLRSPPTFTRPPPLTDLPARLC